MMIVPHALFVRDPVDRLMHQAGVPRELWNAGLDQISFVTTSVWGAKFDPKAQRQAIEDYAKYVKLGHKNPRRPSRSFFAVVSSEPTGNGAKALGAALIRNVVKAQLEKNASGKRKRSWSDRLTFSFIDISSWTRPKFRHDDKDPDIVVLHGVFDNSTDLHLDATRQALNYYYGTVRVLALAGATDPEKWCLTKLRLRPHIAYKVKDIDPTFKL